MLQSPEPRSGQECHIFTMAVPQGAGKRNWVLDVEVYSKDGRGRKDQYSSWSGEWVAGRTWVSEEGGAGREWQPRESGSRGQEAGADTASHPATPPCCAPPLGTHRASASDQRGPRLSFCSRAIGKYLLFVFFFFSSDTLIWDVWQKKKLGPHACCPAKMKVQGLVQTITFLKSYLQKEKFP